MLETLEAIGASPKPWAYTIEQASAPPRERDAEELLGFLDTESYSENTSKSSVELNPYLLMCNLEGKILTYDIITHGNNFIEQFLSDLISKFRQTNNNTEVYIIAHNFSGHDAILLLNSFATTIENSSPQCSIVYRSGNVYTLTVSWKNYLSTPIQIRFQCSLILFQNSLENVSTSFDNDLQNFPMPHSAIDSVEALNSRDVSALLKYLNTKHDNNSLLDMWTTTNSESVMDYANHYCRNDVELLEYIYATFKSEYETTIITQEISNYDFITISRLAQTTWDSNINFNERLVPNIHNSTFLGFYLSAAYYGGKCEVYNGFLDNGTLCHYFDYPGIYGIAIQQPIPVGVPTFVEPQNLGCPQFFLTTLHNNGLCAYLTVNFETPLDCHIPILPTNGSLSNGVPKLIFCKGTATGTYYSYELEHAINNGYNIHEIYHGYVFNSHNTLNPYSSYISQLNGASSTNNDNVRALLFNLLANSLYGNFGIQRQAQTSFTSIKLESLLSHLDQLHPLTTGTSLACHSIQDVNTTTNIAIAASVASWGRIILSFGVESVLRDNPESKLMYVDTDSIFVQAPGEVTCNNMWNNTSWATQSSYKNASFLASNLYTLTNFDGSLVLKINGVNPHNMSSESFQSASAMAFNIIVENIDLWSNSLPGGIGINQITNTFLPYNSPNRRLTIERDKWTGNTSPFSFSSLKSPPTLAHTPDQHPYSSPPSNTQISTDQTGIEYRLDSVYLSPHPATNSRFNAYTITTHWAFLNWPTMYHLVGSLANKLTANRVGMLLIEARQAAHAALSSNYVEYPSPYSSLGASWIESFISYQVSKHLSHYAPRSSGSPSMALVVQFLCEYNSFVVSMFSLIDQERTGAPRSNIANRTDVVQAEDNDPNHTRDMS